MLWWWPSIWLRKKEAKGTSTTIPWKSEEGGVSASGQGGLRAPVGSLFSLEPSLPLRHLRNVGGGGILESNGLGHRPRSHVAQG